MAHTNLPPATAVAEAGRRRIARRIDALTGERDRDARATVELLQQVTVTVHGPRAVRANLPVRGYNVTRNNDALDTPLDIDLTAVGADDTTAACAQITKLDAFTHELTW